MRTAIVAAGVASALVALTVAAQAQGPVPRQSKEFTIVEPSGKKTLLSSQKGKVVYVQFLDTTCPHCRDLSILLTKLQAEYGPKGFQAFGVAFNETTGKAAKDYSTRYNLGIPVGSADRNTVFNYLGLSVMQRIGVPQAVIIDKNGVIQEQSTPTGGGPLGNEVHLRQMIEKLLAK